MKINAWLLLLALCAFFSCDRSDSAPTSNVELETEYIPSAMNLPSTDIFLCELNRKNDELSITAAINVTDRSGYDNQPSFSSDGNHMFFTSGRDQAQTDIYVYSLEDQTIRQWTDTSASEYSPTSSPDGGLTTVHESAEGQPLWSFDADGQDLGALQPDLQPVGYFAWIDDDTTANFIFDPTATAEDPGDPSKLVLSQVSTGQTETIAENVGRSIHPVANGNGLSFIQKTESGIWQIALYDRATKETTLLTETRPDKEDFAWLNRNPLLLDQDILLMGEGSILMAYHLDTGWKFVADLLPYGIRDITRIAVHPSETKIAIVSSRLP